VHGIGTSHRFSAFLHRALAPCGPTDSVDLPGFGGTETPRRRLAVEEYAVLLGSVLDTLLGKFTRAAAFLSVISWTPKLRLIRRSQHGLLHEFAGHRYLVHYSAADRVAHHICRLVQSS
jgi:hypothetical protein